MQWCCLACAGKQGAWLCVAAEMISWINAALVITALTMLSLLLFNTVQLLHQLIKPQRVKIWAVSGHLWYQL